MLRVFVIGRTAADASRLKALAIRAGAVVSGEGDPRSRPADDVNVVLVEDRAVAPYIAADRGQNAPKPTLVIGVSAGGDVPDAWRGVGWGIVEDDAPAARIGAALSAVAAGFEIRPASSGARPRVAAPMSDDGEQVEALTPRELDVLELLAGGLSNRRIADTLQLSEHTVKFHLASIFGKLQASTRTEAVRQGLRRGLVRL